MKANAHITIPFQGHEVEFDTAKAADDCASSVESADLWIADVRWFVPRVIVLSIAGVVFSFYAVAVDSSVWPILMLNLFGIVGLLLLFGCTLIGRLWAANVGFYIALLSLVCTIVALLLWLTIFAKDLQHEALWLWWTLTAIQILSCFVYTALFVAYTSIVHYGLVLHSYHNLFTEFELLNWYEKSAPPMMPKKDE